MVNKKQLNQKELFNLAFYNQKLNNFDVAINLYNQLIEANHNIPLIYYKLGLIYERQQKKQLAKKNYKKTSLLLKK